MGELLFDSHTHLCEERFDEDREELIASLREQGVGGCLVVGANLEYSPKSVELASRYPDLYASVGLCPQEGKILSRQELDLLSRWAAHDKTVAIGEIGLDYYYDDVPKDVQKVCLRQQVQLAADLKLPVVYHVRDAWGDFLEYLKTTPVRSGVMHCFSGSAEVAQTCVQAGLYISFSGSLTFQNARKLVEAAATVPLDRLLVETDCPFLAPVPLRGKRNQPAYVRYVAEKLAEIRGMDTEEIIALTRENAYRFLNIGG